jgi:hypothetical protein
VTAAAIPDGRGLRDCAAELAADTAAGKLRCRAAQASQTEVASR